MISSLKPQFERVLSPLAQALSAINPNVVTLLGVIPAILFFISTLNGLYIIALFSYSGTVIDAFDGLLARISKKVTPFGGFLDSTLDRLSDFLIISAFGFAHIVRFEIVILLLCVSFLTSYIRSRGELIIHKPLTVGLIERPERLVVIFIAYISFVFFPFIQISSFFLPEIIFFILSLMSLFTCLQRIYYVYIHSKTIRE